MTPSLLQILVPLVASLGAALVAGVASYLAGRGARSHEWKLGLIRESLQERQRHAEVAMALVNGDTQAAIAKRLKLSEPAITKRVLRILAVGRAELGDLRGSPILT